MQFAYEHPSQMFKYFTSNLYLLIRWHLKQKLLIRVPLLSMVAWGLSEQRDCTDTM